MKIDCGATIFDHQLRLEEFCTEAGIRPEDLDIHVMIIASCTEVCKEHKGKEYARFPPPERESMSPGIQDYKEVSEFFGRFKHLTMVIGGSGQNWQIPGFDIPMNEIVTQLAAHSG